MSEDYEEPAVTDYGSLRELTEATSIFGPEDGASKINMDSHHSLQLEP